VHNTINTITRNCQPHYPNSWHRHLSKNSMTNF